MKRKANKTLKQKAAYLARPLEVRPRDLYKLQERQTLRNEHLMQQHALHKRNERERLGAMIHQNIQPALRATLIKNRDMLK
jgi:hypothetical protein